MASSSSSKLFQLEAVAKGAIAKKTSTAPMKCAAIGNKGDYVVLIPGLLSSFLSMSKINAAFKEAGFKTICFRYSWLKYSPTEIANQFLTKLIKTHCTDVKKKINFISHSTGGLILYQYLKHNKDLRFNRAVMIAPPFGGSEFINWFERYFGWICRKLGPTYAALALSNIHSVKPVPQIELGVIAGASSINPLSYFLIKGQNDGFISVESTKLPGTKEHLVVPLSHYFLLISSNVITKTVSFIKQGCF